MMCVWKLNISEQTLHLKMKFSLKDFFSKCDHIRKKKQIWSHLLKKPYWKTSFFVQRNTFKRPQFLTNIADYSSIGLPDTISFTGTRERSSADQ